MREDILLMGHSGVGKSTYVQEAAKKLKLPYMSMQITSELEEKDVTSKLQFNE
jgi:MoxR-like ATPase